MHTAIDIGLIFCMGYIVSDYRKGKGMEFYLRYYEGITDISKYQGLDYKNRMFQFSVSFPFILSEDKVE